MIDHEKIKALARAVIKTEYESVQKLIDNVDQHFVQACELIMQCKGRVVVIGMGKSGHIASKIAATLASTGTPAFFVHPGEASHGDLGMITAQDVVIAISYSGETEEVLQLLPLIKLLKVPLISLTGNPSSTLSLEASTNIDVSIAKEACPMNLTPTASTTVTLVMGDALAISLLQLKNFTADDFARSHPGGSLGRRLLLRVSDIMHKEQELPIVNQSALIKDALIEMSAKGFGSTFVVDDNNLLIGIFTDGDIRRTLDKHMDINQTVIKTVIGKQFTTCKAEDLAASALRIMEDLKITMLPITNEKNTPVGLVHMHDIIRSGLI